MDIPGVIRTTLKRWNRKRSKCKLFEGLVMVKLYQQHFDGNLWMSKYWPNKWQGKSPSSFLNCSKNIANTNFVNFSQNLDGPPEWSDFQPLWSQ